MDLRSVRPQAENVLELRPRGGGRKASASSHNAACSTINIISQRNLSERYRDCNHLTVASMAASDFSGLRRRFGQAATEVFRELQDEIDEQQEKLNDRKAGLDFREEALDAREAQLVRREKVREAAFVLAADNALETQWDEIARHGQEVEAVANVFQWKRKHLESREAELAQRALGVAADEMTAALKTEIADKVIKCAEQKETELEEKVENTIQRYADAHEMISNLSALQVQLTREVEEIGDTLAIQDSKVKKAWHWLCNERLATLEAQKRIFATRVSKESQDFTDGQPRVLLNEVNDNAFPEWWNEKDFPPQGCWLEIHGNDHMFRVKDCKWERVEWFPCTEIPDHHLFPIHDAISTTSTQGIALNVQAQAESEMMDRIELWQDDQMKTPEQDTEATFVSRPESPPACKAANQWTR
jgi:hypothetical protein